MFRDIAGVPNPHQDCRMSRPTSAQIIKFTREATGYSQEEFSYLANCSKNTIQRWESGESEPPFKKVIHILEDVCGTTYSRVCELIKEAA